MIYLPDELQNNNCAYWLDSNTIRVYEYTPHQNSVVNYTDYFINSHYLTREGSNQFGSYYNPISCISHDKFTNNYWYRNDIDSICITFATIFFVTMCPIVFIMKSFFKGAFK